jgi:hypothetical protein
VLALPISCLLGIKNDPDVIFRERCLDSLYDDFGKCYKRQESLQRDEMEAWQKCEEETKVLKGKADQLDNALQKKIERLRTLHREALLATQENADARMKQIQCEVSAVKAQAELDITKTRMSLPEGWWSEELMAARYHALNGGAMEEARSRYLDAYEGAIREHKASLMAEDMELVALHLSWRTKRVTSTRSCMFGLDEKWTQRINLCRLRAAPVRSAYENSKMSCRDDLQTEYATAASDLSKRRQDRFKKGAELNNKVQKLVDAIVYQRDKEIAKLEAKITGIGEERRRQVKELRDDYKFQLSDLKSSVQPLVQQLLSTIERRQKVFDREQDVISKDLRAVQATLTLMTSALQTLGPDPNSQPGTHTPRPPSNPDGSCPCGCGRWRGPTHRGDKRPNDPFRHSFAHFTHIFNLDPRQRTYKKFKEQLDAEESRRQREVEEDERRRSEERLKREREEQRRREEAKAHARAEREARERFEREQRRRQEEQARKRQEEEARRKREEEERRRAEADRRAREEKEAGKRAEEEKRRREDARRREESRRREEESRGREDENQQNRQDQQHNNSWGGEDEQSTTGEDDVDTDDRSGGTRGSSTAKRRAKFVLKCWNEYTEAWTGLMASAVSKLRFQEVPWPILPPKKRLLNKMSIADILFRINRESIQTFILDPEHLQSISPKARIRKELLRFHPDKRIQWLKNVKDEEKREVDEACKQVVLHLTDLLNTVA